MQVFKSSLFRFLVVGLVSSILNYGLFFVFYQIYSLHYILSYGIGFISGFILGFLLNKAWSFQVTKTTLYQKTKYLCVYLFSLTLGGFLLRAFVAYLHMIPLLSNIIILFITTCINFCGVKFWAFKK
ncbi:MAG: GtrA family protein [Spirochaetia bacterium]